LETHVDPAVAVKLARLVPELEVELQQRWRGGRLRTAGDDEVLTAAHEDSYLFVTFDVTTISSLLARRYEGGVVSPGVILISRRTFRQNDVGAIVRALARFCRSHGLEEWTGQVVYLGR
jgi:hypothetical protein